MALPLLVVSMTAILIAHSQRFEATPVPVSVSKLPGYQATHVGTAFAELQSFLTTRDGRTLIGTRQGLFQMQGGTLHRVSDIPAVEIRRVREWSNETLLVATKKGVWLQTAVEGAWKKIYAGNVVDIETSPTSIQIATKDKGMWESSDTGAHWQAVSITNQALIQTPLQEEVSWGKLLFDLHTGNALLGRPNRWLWIDAVGISLLFLTLSGLWMGYRSRRKRHLHLTSQKHPVNVHKLPASSNHEHNQH